MATNWLCIFVGGIAFIVLALCVIGMIGFAYFALRYPWHWLYVRYGIRPPR